MQNSFTRWQARQWKNGIIRFKVGETVAENKEELREKVVEFYTNPYTENWEQRPKVNGLLMPRILDFQAGWSAPLRVRD